MGTEKMKCRKCGEPDAWVRDTLLCLHCLKQEIRIQAQVQFLVKKIKRDYIHRKSRVRAPLPLSPKDKHFLKELGIVQW